MTSKHTLISLCAEYDKVEIPIIQRDYAQGRQEQERLRNKFVDYIVNSLENQEGIELDFVYGNVRHDILTDNSNVTTFIPIDGQQRLTTLWLLHWFLSVKEGCLNEMKSILEKFIYETRPMAHSFCHHLMVEDFPKGEITTISDYLEDQCWFDDEWLNDGSVQGMIQMIKTFENKKALTNSSIKLDQLKEPLNNISFFFVPLEDFGLSNELYIRMNARGKILTNFENFKSEFYKIIRDYPQIETIKDKIEYTWVNIFWPHRKKHIFVIDTCFMNYLGFVSKMLFLQQAKTRDDKGYPEDFLNNDILKHLYSNNSNTDFLQYSIDIIPELSKEFGNNLLWEKDKTSLADILSSAINGDSLSIDKQIILFSALVFIKKYRTTYKPHLADFLRTIRNLIFNTLDKSEREWPRILNSVNKLCANLNIYETLSKPGFNLEGFRDAQCQEEHFKSLAIANPNLKELFIEIENNENLCGNIKTLIAGVYESTENKINDFILSDDLALKMDINRLKSIYELYTTFAKDSFDKIWGDLIDSLLYTHNKPSGRLEYDSNYQKNPSIIAFIISYLDSKNNDIQSFIISEEKKYVRKLQLNGECLSDIRNPKVQLKLLFIISCRLMQCDYVDFFKSDGYQFGWLSKETGFMSLFKSGIEDDLWFATTNPIFQTYRSQFRYNGGLNEAHTLPPEIVGNGKPKNVWRKLKDWSLK